MPAQNEESKRSDSEGLTSRRMGWFKTEERTKRTIPFLGRRIVVLRFRSGPTGGIRPLHPSAWSASTRKETRYARRAWCRMEAWIRTPRSNPRRIKAIGAPRIARLSHQRSRIHSRPTISRPWNVVLGGHCNIEGRKNQTLTKRSFGYDRLPRRRLRGAVPNTSESRRLSIHPIGRKVLFRRFDWWMAFPSPVRWRSSLPVRNRPDVRCRSIRTSENEASPFEARLKKIIMISSDAERILKDRPLKKAPFSSAIVACTAHSGSEKTGLWAYLDGSRMFFAGGAAGAVARTCTAPLDRIKLLFQVQAVQSAGVSSTAYTGVWQSVAKIWKEEGVRAYWKGNGTNVIRIFPYSAAQLMANDQYKRMLADEGGNLSVAKRLTAGACAGMTATALTHPLDTVRLRLALPNNTYNGMMNAVVNISSKEGVAALYKGLAPTLIGIAPYAALNFSSYDLLKTWAYGSGNAKQSPLTNIGIGAAAGTFAATVCYPLDTVRRRMQMPGHVYSGQVDALVQIFQKEGMRGFFRGWAANTLKVVPQNSIRFVTYEFLKSMLGVKKAKTDT